MRSSLTATHMKELSKLAPAVAQKVNALKKEHGKRKVSFSTYPAGHKHWLGEGEDITFFAPTGKSAEVSMVSQDSLVAAGVSQSIGYSPALPEGTWIVTVSYYYGAHISLTYIGQTALTVN